MSPGDAELQGLSGISKMKSGTFPCCLCLLETQRICWYHSAGCAAIPHSTAKPLRLWLIFQALFPPSAGQWLKACQGYFLGPQRLFVPLVGRFDFHPGFLGKKSKTHLHRNWEMKSNPCLLKLKEQKYLFSILQSPLHHHRSGLPSPGLHTCMGRSFWTLS